MSTKKNPPSEENNNSQENNNNMNEENLDDATSHIPPFISNEPPNIIELGQASELLALPPEIVTALCYSGLLREYHDLAPQTQALYLDDVIRVASLLNSYREYHREVVSNLHESEVRGILDQIGGFKMNHSQYSDELSALHSEFPQNSPYSN